MTDRRLSLHDLLLSYADNVYFQAPENIKMKYPAILYRPDEEVRKHANNGAYGLVDGWEITIIDKDPDSPIRQALRTLPLCSFERMFRTEGLNHFIYSLYY